MVVQVLVQRHHFIILGLELCLLDSKSAVEVAPFLLSHQSHCFTFNFNQWKGVADIVSLALLLSSVCCSVQPEELTLMLIKLRRQQAELNSLREHTVAQLMALGMEGSNAKVSTVYTVGVWVCACTHLPIPNQAVKILCVFVCPQGEITGVRLLVCSK